MKNLFKIFIFCLLSFKAFAFNAEFNYSDTSNTLNLEEYKDIKIYKNKNTNQIVIIGKVTKIKDGDTIVIGNLFNARLYGIDIPESKQKCLDKNNNQYNCGIKAKKYSEKLITNKNITCIYNGNEKYGRFLFVCENNKHNINQEMVRNGWALSYFNDEYKTDEEYAKQNKFGIWQGSFERHKIWRRNNKSKK